MTQVWKCRISTSDEREHAAAQAEQHYSEMISALADGIEIDEDIVEQVAVAAGRTPEQFGLDCLAALSARDAE